MSKIFTNPNQLEEWVEAAEGIQDRYGIEKALGYLIGEKFYELVFTVHHARKIARPIVDETYEQKKEIIIEAEGLLLKFVFLISQAFNSHEIRKYFNSHPRLGVHGHVLSEEQFEVMVNKGVIEHSIETEIEDALIFGEMMKYFGINV